MPITLSELYSVEEDIQPLDIASIVWKQGWYFYKLKPPYTQKDLVGSKKPFAGTKIHKGIASAYKSVAKVDGVELPKHIELDLGIQDIVLEADDKGKDVRIYYKADLKQRTTAGPVTGEFAKYGTRRRTVRRSSGGGTPLLGGLK
jgi:hypothetical protein